MSDLLTVTSLIVAVVGMLYTAWYPEISQARDTQFQKYENQARIQKVNIALKRMIPLATVALALCTALVPPIWSLACKTVTAGQVGSYSYDAVATCFVITFMILVFLDVLFWRDVCILTRHRRDQRANT